ncbi:MULTISPECIES: fimbrial protein [Edwardsiella]|uniref:Fimbrial protein MrfG n=2 Tax=Edwardsiella anguillarum TaxID=1821960 RepID=A0A076LJJ3_9GAMM|nr:MULTISPECIES: fimbrial protein [Edwardsiella]GAJ66138.1 fimbrial protein [Edwardsiella piscicida]AIJ06753.1 fimbrial protein MrfG [Edwardsiella anguillarum ET080813]AKR78231.2 type 1 fimbrial protein [Edwardsiella sp. LADL05-105]MDA6077269.1 fimbrial protein [Edwardsiella anguillarum]UOU77929.1 type 1 fimbrial protein [Edwardsiella anguillarum]
MRYPAIVSYPSWILHGGMKSIVLIVLLSIGQVVWATGDNNLNFDGILVTEPCTLDPDTTDITLDFGTVVDKYLYTNMRTASKVFNIRLLDCDVTLGQSVRVTFGGMPNKELPTLLALSSGPASGIAIGMEKSDGSALPLNKSTPSYTLMSGDNILTFKGYVQGEPTALLKHSIILGNFTAVATFTLEYL